MTLQAPTIPVFGAKEETATLSKTALNVPWNVVVHNDPVNLMSYVTLVFQRVFSFPSRRRSTTCGVHQKGRSVVWLRRARTGRDVCAAAPWALAACYAGAGRLKGQKMRIERDETGGFIFSQQFHPAVLTNAGMHHTGLHLLTGQHIHRAARRTLHHHCGAASAWRSASTTSACTASPARCW